MKSIKVSNLRRVGTSVSVELTDWEVRLVAGLLQSRLLEHSIICEVEIE